MAHTNKFIVDVMADHLFWFPELGFGYYPVHPSDAPYNADYFNKYVGYAATDRGRGITRFRCGFVNAHADGAHVVDIGIGCGDFVQARPGTVGYDVNPAGVAWLKDRGLWFDAGAATMIDAITCWDSLEHIEEPLDLLAKVRRFVFVTIPIFRDAEHVVTSKHFRKDEHYWYFTQRGFLDYMHRAGFETLAISEAEVALGREDVMSFAFKRVT